MRPRACHLATQLPWPTGSCEHSGPHIHVWIPKEEKGRVSALPAFKSPSPKFCAVQKGSAPHPIPSFSQLYWQIWTSLCCYVLQGSRRAFHQPRAFSMQCVLLPYFCPGLGSVIMHCASVSPTPAPTVWCFLPTPPSLLGLAAPSGQIYLYQLC